MRLQPRHQRKLLFLSIAGALGACSDGTRFVTGFDAPTASVVATITGSAVKGAIVGGDCIVLDSDNTTVLYTTVGATDACTGSDGSYSIPLTIEPTGPVIVQIQGRSTTTMSCDALDCGGGVSAGGTVDLSAISLRTILPEVVVSTVPVEININPWTEIAANRAITLFEQAADADTTVTTLTVENTNQGFGEVAGLLNNILGVEGTSNAFDSNFASIDMLDLANTSTEVDEGEETLGTLLAIASTSLFGLVDTTDANAGSITDVITELAESFEDDAAINVNSTADGIDTNESFDLTQLTQEIVDTVQELDDILETEELAVVTEALAASDDVITLTELEETVTEISEAKETVEDQDDDPTAPVAVIDEGLTADQEALTIAVQFDNATTATDVALNTDSGSNTALEDINELVEQSSIDELDLIENMGELIIMAAELIDGHDDTTSDVASLNCDTSDSAIVTCTTAELATILPNDSPFTTAAGSLTLTKATDVVTTSDIVVDGDLYSLTLTGADNGTDSAEPTSLVFTITSGSIDIGDTGTAEITVGPTSTLSGARTLTDDSVTDETGTISLDDISITLTDAYDFSGDVTIGFQYILEGADLDEDLLTNVAFNGTITNNLANSAINASNGDTVIFSANYTLDATQLDPTSDGLLPSTDTDDDRDAGEIEETDSNFYSITAANISITTPVTYEKQVIATDFSSTSASADTAVTETLTITASTTRTTQAPATDFELDFRLRDADGNITALFGDITSADGEDDTFVFTNGTSGVSLTLVDTDSSDDSDTNSAFTGSIAAGSGDDTATGTISDSGVVTIGGLSISFQLRALDPEN